VTSERTVEQVVQDLNPEQRKYLWRVLELERARLHQPNPDMTDDLVAAVKEIIP